jgi:hypothetical protein
LPPLRSGSEVVTEKAADALAAMDDTAGALPTRTINQRIPKP